SRAAISRNDCVQTPPKGALATTRWAQSSHRRSVSSKGLPGPPLRTAAGQRTKEFGMTRNISGGTGNGNGDNNDNIIHLPATEAERRQMRKLLRAQERQRLVDVFIGEGGRQRFSRPQGVSHRAPHHRSHPETGRGTTQ